MTLLLPMVLATCKPDLEKPVVIVSPPGNNLPGGSSAATTLPKLLEVRVEGIPKENITIDEAKKEVTILVPTSITSRLPATEFRVSDNAQVVRPMGLNLLYPGSIDLNIGGLPTTNVSYQIRLQPAGELAVGPLPTPFVYETGSSLGLPIYNFYDGSYPAKLVLTRKSTGEVTKINVYDYPSASTQSMGTLLFWPVIEQYAIPAGEYTAEIQKENGRHVTFPQPLLVKRGLPKLAFYGHYVTGTTNRNLAIGGVNLFEDEQLEVQLIDPDGRESRLKPTDYNNDGRWLKVALAEDARPGYYAFRLIRQGQAAGDYWRLPVINSPVQPYFGYLEGYTFDPLTKNSVVLSRAKSYRFSIGPYCLLRPQLKFIRVDNPQVEQSVEVVVGGVCETGTSVTSFTLPATFEPGMYKLVLAGTTYSNLNMRSEPFERTIEVR